MLHLSHIPNKINATKLLNFTQIRLNKIEHSVSVYHFFFNFFICCQLQRNMCWQNIYVALILVIFIVIRTRWRMKFHIKRNFYSTKIIKKKLLKLTVLQQYILYRLKYLNLSSIDEKSYLYMRIWISVWINNNQKTIY